MKDMVDNVLEPSKEKRIRTRKKRPERKTPHGEQISALKKKYGEEKIRVQTERVRDDIDPKSLDDCGAARRKRRTKQGSSKTLSWRGNIIVALSPTIFCGE